MHTATPYMRKKPVKADSECMAQDCDAVIASWRSLRAIGMAQAHAGSDLSWPRELARSRTRAGEDVYGDAVYEEEAR